MTENPIQIKTAMMLNCEGCHPLVTKPGEKPDCPLIRFQDEFAGSDKTLESFQELAIKFGLDKTFYIESNNVPHFKCTKKESPFSGRLAIFISSNK